MAILDAKVWTRGRGARQRHSPPFGIGKLQRKMFSTRLPGTDGPYSLVRFAAVRYTTPLSRLPTAMTVTSTMRSLTS
jgi:hypothetical protein